MKSKLLHEHSMAEYLYTRPELLDENWLTDKAKEVGHSVADMAGVYGLDPRPAIDKVGQGIDKIKADHEDNVPAYETLDDGWDALEQVLPWVSRERKQAKILEKDNDGMIRALRGSTTVWGDVLKGADSKDFDLGAVFKKWGIVDDLEWFTKTAIALMSMNKRNWGEVIDSVQAWTIDLTGGGKSNVSKGLGLALTIGSMAAGMSTLGVGLGVLALAGAAAYLVSGEEKDVLNYIRNELGDPGLADCLEKGSDGAEGGTPSIAADVIQLMFWKYENYFLKVIAGSQDYDPAGLKTFDEWYDSRQYAGEGLSACKSKNKRGK